MANFYYGCHEHKSYWVNLDQICFVTQEEEDKLVLNMSNGSVVTINEEYYEDLKEFIISETVNWGALFDEPPVDYGYEILNQPMTII